MISIEELISEVNRNGGSDLHLVRGLPPKYRKDGRLLNLGEIPLTEEACEEYARELAGVRYETIKEIGELDLARSFGSVRVRVNLFRQQGTVSSAIRLLKEEIPQLSTLGLPPAAWSFRVNAMVLFWLQERLGRENLLHWLLYSRRLTAQGKPILSPLRIRWSISTSRINVS